LFGIIDITFTFVYYLHVISSFLKRCLELFQKDKDDQRATSAGKSIIKVGVRAKTCLFKPGSHIPMGVRSGQNYERINNKPIHARTKYLNTRTKHLNTLTKHLNTHTKHSNTRNEYSNTNMYNKNSNTRMNFELAFHKFHNAHTQYSKCRTQYSKCRTQNIRKIN
jgi:hypothetical protein